VTICPAPWSYSTSSATLVGDAGRAWLNLGQHDRAGANLHRGLRPLGDSHPRNRSLHSTSLAEIRISSGDVDGAADVVHDAVQLVGQTSPVRTRCRLRKFEHEFTNHGDRLQRERQAT
jgi:ATP/maltotriose-dependent transcriptional regulator MalT